MTRQWPQRHFRVKGQKSPERNLIGLRNAAWRAAAVNLGYAEAKPSSLTNPFIKPLQSLHPPGVGPGIGHNGGPKLAMDDANIAPVFNWGQAFVGANFAEGQGFLGYPYLAELAQRPEYRVISETIATEMTRKWIKLKSKSGKDNSDRIKTLDDVMQRLKVRDVITKWIEQDGFFGRSHLYIDTGDTEDRDELTTPIGDGHNEISRTKIGKGSIKRFDTVEAVWTYPTNYNSNDPLRADWYNPQTWFVMGKQVHISRLLKLVMREVPDLLKPAYSFGGLSLSQMVKPYVDNWLVTRQSVQNIIRAFTTWVLMTNMSAAMQSDGQEIFDRALLFNRLRDNGGLMMLDKEDEEFKNVSAPLGTLDQLQAQAQEHMASVSRIPLVKLLGISPHGMNATAEPELRAFYDTIRAQQESKIRSPIWSLLGFIQLSEFGDIDDDLDFDFVPLWELDEKQQAEVQKIKAETAQIHIDSGAVSPEEERGRIVDDPDSGYDSLNADDVPDLLEEEQEGLQPLKPGRTGGGGVGDMALDDSHSWNEEDHPRDDDSKFSRGHHSPSRVENGKRVQLTGEELPAHIQSLKIPPAWTDVTFSHDLSSDLLVTGKDTKGRRQAIYSQVHNARQAAAKFGRIEELSNKLDAILKQISVAQKSSDTSIRDAADCAYVIAVTGIRPGSEEDTGAEKQAYGVTTLLGRHVTVENDQVVLKFVGKKGVDLSIPVTDPKASKILLNRKKSGADRQIFSINERQLLGFVHSLDGGFFKTKDFRTLLGTRTAMDEVSKRSPPLNEKDYKRKVMDVAKVVSRKLGNTPTIALQSYINPGVFSSWRIAV